MVITQIDIKLISVPDDRVKRLDPAATELKAADIAKRGLMQPITVTSVDGGYELVAGYGRLAACIDLDWADIPAHVHEFETPDHKREWEIMENVVRDELTALDRARSLYELDKIYKERFPELQKGGDKQTDEAREKLTAIVAVRSELLDQLDLSERSFRRAIELWKGLKAPTRFRLQGTWLANQQSGLIALSKVSREKQDKVMNILFPIRGEPGATSVADALFLIEHGEKPSSQDRKLITIKRSFDKLNTSELDTVFSDLEEKIKAWAARTGRAL